MELFESATLDEVLNTHAPALGGDFTGYRNHAHRVMNLCLALSHANNDARQDKIAIAAAFHDLGIWTADTFDYIEPSAKLATAHLVESGQGAWTPEIETSIRAHHKLSRYRPHPEWLAEPFRRADLVDLSRGVIRFGLPRGFINDLYARWPSAGFHGRLVQLSLTRLKTHPLSPLPMVRL